MSKPDILHPPGHTTSAPSICSPCTGIYCTTGDTTRATPAGGGPHPLGTRRRCCAHTKKKSVLHQTTHFTADGTDASLTLTRFERITFRSGVERDYRCATRPLL